MTLKVQLMTMKGLLNRFSSKKPAAFRQNQPTEETLSKSIVVGFFQNLSSRLLFWGETSFKYNAARPSILIMKLQIAIFILYTFHAIILNILIYFNELF